MRKKLAFIVIYLMICLVPLCTVWMSKDTSASEKREQAAFPHVTEDGKLNKDYFTQFDAWFSDYMGGRSWLVKAQTSLKEKLFGESSENQVILGKNGWLYYAETADDYCHVRTFSDRNANNIARTLRLMSDYCAERDAEFVFTVAPNKNTLYPENMPDRYHRAEGPSNLDAVVSQVYDLGVKFVDLRDAFGADSRVLYQERDSHWTYEGGMLAYRTIIGRLSSQHDLFEDVKFTERNDWDADLANMLYPDAPDDDMQKYPDIEYTFTAKGVVFDESLVIETVGGAGEGSLLMFRDSFGNTTWRYFAQAFKKAEFERAVPYRMSSVDRVGADTVILEIVERNLINLASKAPLMVAPRVEIDILDAIDMPGDYNFWASEESGEMTHIYGYLDETWLGDSYRVYMVAKEGEDSVFYEAFPVFEQELLGAAELGDNGFSCYLPEGMSESSVIGVLVETKGRYYYSVRK